MYEYELLVCRSCDRTWERRVTRGRKPHTCPRCRPAPATRLRPRLRPPSTILTNPKSPVVYTDGGKSDAGFPYEQSDCTVRALATATGSTYQAAHAFMANNGRRNGRGHAFSSVLSRNDNRVLGHRTTPTQITRARGLRTALLRNPELRKGTWIIQQSRHVVTLRNGVLLDAFDSSAKEFRYAWLVTPL